MARFYCFPTLLGGKKKKVKESTKSVNCSNKLQVNPSELVEPYNEKIKETSFVIQNPLVNGSDDNKTGNFITTSNEKGSHENSPTCNQVTEIGCLDAVEAAYEGGDEHDEILSLRRDFSDFDLQAQAEGKGDIISKEPEMSYNFSKNETTSENAANELMIKSGHLSDPGIGRTTALWGSPRLKRSCSNIETRISAQPALSPSKSLSYDDLRNISEKANGEVSFGIKNSPLSVLSSCSADKIMLKKRSSSQVLPSRSRKVWWKLFLWSHRNSHKSWIPKTTTMNFVNDISNQKGGYSSDTVEPNDSSNKQLFEVEENQWVAFSMEASPFDRVNAWVNTLSDQITPIDNEEDDEELQRQDVASMTIHDIGESSGRNHARAGKHLPEEVSRANNIIQSLNSLSSGAHICGMGLKVLPAISAFSSLRSVNLSNNLIVHVTPGALPKGLQTLDLSRNKITAIDGLRELTRLRFLNLSYNRLSRIGHGLSNCTLVKELYLAGNKISNVEGLHRLLKLNLLDLSFNKISTAKSLGQLVANYNSLLAINLLGNPIQSNIGDDQLRKAVSGLLPNLTYLNKQSIKPQRAREAASDSIAKAALGDSGWNSRRKTMRRVNQGSGSSVRGRMSEASGQRGNSGSRSVHRSKSRHK